MKYALVIHFRVKEQKLIQLSASWVVSNSYNYVKSCFHFDGDDWDEKGITAVFSFNGREYPVTLDRTNTCRVPWEVLMPPEFYVYLIGGSIDGGEMITTNSVSIEVHPSSSFDFYNNAARNPTPDIYQQVVDKLAQKQDTLIETDSISIDDHNNISVKEEYINNKLEPINIKLADLEAKMVDSIVFDRETNELWLAHGDEQISTKISLGKWISSAKISDGKLIVIYSDGVEEIIGNISSGGKTMVYVPTIDDHKILTLTLQEEPGEDSYTCDLNPFDEWSEVEDDEPTDYIWESL